MDSLYLNTKEASRRFGISERTLMLWREKRRGPKYYRAGHKVLYKAEDIEKFIEGWLVNPENQATRRPNFLKGRA